MLLIAAKTGPSHELGGDQVQICMAAGLRFEIPGTAAADDPGQRDNAQPYHVDDRSVPFDQAVLALRKPPAAVGCPAILPSYLRRTMCLAGSAYGLRFQALKSREIAELPH